MMRTRFCLAMLMVCMLVALNAAVAEEPGVSIKGTGTFNGDANLVIDGNFVEQGVAYNEQGCVTWEAPEVYFVVDLGKQVEIVDLAVQVDDNDDYTFEVSTNGTEYSPLMKILADHGEVTPGMDKITTIAEDPDLVKAIDFQPVKARFIKVSATGGDEAYSIAEIQVIHTPSETNVTEEKPVDEKPAATEEKPAATEEKPAATEEKPVDEKPAATEEKPAATEEKPAATEADPDQQKAVNP